jgi:hypothetical protein
MPFRIAQPICALDFTVDGVMMAHQPFSVRFVTAEPNLRRTVAGRWLGARRFGRRAVIQWGEEFCSAAALAEIRTIFGATNPAHTITWNEPDGSIVSLDIVSENVRSRFQQDAPGFYDPLILTCWERP